MQILGHSILAMTQHFEHVLSTMLTDAADALERVMAPSVWPRASRSTG